MKISVVVRCLNEEAHIGRLLTGLTKQLRVPDEVIVVDSGSTDATLEIASRFGSKVLHIAPEQFSFGRSLNLGLDAATGEVVVIASAHVYPVYDSWIDELIRPFENDDVALTYGRQVGDKVTKYSEHRILAKWFPSESIHRQEHPFCNNANAAIRRSVWADTPYDERLTGLEDVDWARRIMDAGRHLSYVATAPVVHVHEETRAQIVNRYRREAIAHKRIFEAQRFGLRELVWLTAANVLSDWYHAALDGVLADSALDIPRFRLAQFWGTYRGFAQEGPVPERLKRRFYYPTRPRDRSRVDLDEPGDAIDYGVAMERLSRDE